jgi:hypothetical protein
MDYDRKKREEIITVREKNLSAMEYTVEKELKGEDYNLDNRQKYGSKSVKYWKREFSICKSGRRVCQASRQKL